MTRFDGAATCGDADDTAIRLRYNVDQDTAMKRIAAIAAAALLAGTAPSLASPPSKPCTSADKSTWMKMDDAKAKLVKDGYSVRRIKVAMNCFEAYVVKDGKRQELFLDPVSGKVVETRDN